MFVVLSSVYIFFIYIRRKRSNAQWRVPPQFPLVTGCCGVQQPTRPPPSPKASYTRHLQNAGDTVILEPYFSL